MDVISHFKINFIYFREDFSKSGFIFERQKVFINSEACCHICVFCVIFISGVGF